MSTTIALLVMLGLLLAVAGYFISVYNSFVKLSKTMDSSLADIDVQLKKRYDLVPKLADTVEGYASHESDVFKAVAGLRSNAMQVGSMDERNQMDSTLKGLFKSLFAVAEAYPELKADENFRQLQSQLFELEDGIENARRYYNAVVRDNNIYRDSFPSNIIGGMFNFRQGEFFGVRSDAEREPGPALFKKGQ